LRLTLSLLAVVVLASISSLRPPRADPLPGFPRVILWAWERPEDLRFVRPGAVGIAFLARTVWLDGSSAYGKPRLQPLRYSPGTPLMAVVRVESTGRGLPPTADALREAMAAAELPGVRALQIDFDARQSERAWYRAMLGELRRALPPALPLTITALVSWCEDDGWIRDLPVADASPMLFRMGPGERPPTEDFRVPLCRSSIGLSTDELPATVVRSRRLFFFHPRPWTPAAYQAVIAQAWRWR